MGTGLDTGCKDKEDEEQLKSGGKDNRKPTVFTMQNGDRLRLLTGGGGQEPESVSERWVV